VDSTKPPGHTSLTKIYGKDDWFLNIITLKNFFLSPNFIWFLISVIVYFVFPYDYESAKTWSLSFALNRLLVNFFVIFGYTLFWYILLFTLRWSKRKFDAKYFLPSTRLFHNMYYCALGVVQWTAWEVVFVHIYATNKLDFISDEEAFSSWENVVRMVGWSLIVPLWREIHFYFSHRFIHIRALYKYVHSLHHRNTDPDPFSGICMHPVEHLYYFSSILPSLYFKMSPFHFLWNGMHLTLSPVCSHSGWEDHWQSDMFHYLHHARFECNYGTLNVPIDNWFGTFRDKIVESTTYKGHGTIHEKETEIKKEKARGWWWKGVVPGVEQGIYNAMFLVICVVVGMVVVEGERSVLGRILSDRFVAALLAVGPILIGIVMQFIGTDKLSALWPFHKESKGSFGLHLIIGFCFTVLPVYHTVTTVLSGV